MEAPANVNFFSCILGYFCVKYPIEPTKVSIVLSPAVLYVFVTVTDQQLLAATTFFKIENPLNP